MPPWIVSTSQADDAAPEVSVILCTRNRPHTLGTALTSILSGTYTRWELLVVDQSADTRSTDIVRAIAAGDPRVRYWRSEAAGKTLALNAALGRARGRLLAFTDDDCEVRPDWIARIVRRFDGDSTLAVLVGGVVAAPHDASRGFVPTYEPKRVLRGLAVLRSGWSPMGANMAIRRYVPAQIGPFDPLLGAGGPLRSSYDVEYCYRALRGGLLLMADPSIVVVHHGFRPWSDGRRLVHNYAYGTAAVYMKFIRLGDRRALALFGQDLAIYIGRLLARTALMRRPIGVTALISRLRGAWESLCLSIDRETGLYVGPRAPELHGDGRAKRPDEGVHA